MQSNDEEMNRIEKYFFDFEVAQKVNKMFADFANRIKKGDVKSDGTDPLLSVIDKCIYDDPFNAFHKIVNKGTCLYRARVIAPKELDKMHGFRVGNYSGYNESGSREAPLGKSPAGRNNISGVSYLYLANKPETACCEVKPGLWQLISLAEFEIMKPLSIIDFSFDESKNMNDDYYLDYLFSNIMRLYSAPVTNEDNYKATQFLADYIRKTGIDGICYRSSYHDSGINYTIFNSNRRNIKFNDSKIMLLQNERHTFLDFVEERLVTADSYGGTEYDSKTAESIRSQIFNQIIRNEHKVKF